MANWICQQCNTPFVRDKNGERPIRFCSQSCYHAWRHDNHVVTGQFPQGSIPWNKGKNGVRLSPHSEFKPGIVPTNKVPLGTVKIRMRRRSAKRRAWVKVEEPNVWKLRATVVWEQEHGPIPSGFLIHHIDRDTLNDSPENLTLLSRAEHLKEHRHEFEARRKAMLSRKRDSQGVCPILRAV